MKTAKGQFSQQRVAVKMHDCEVHASAHARLFHIRADEKAVTWIHTGLRRAVKDYLDGESRAMSHTEPQGDCEKRLK